MRGPRQASGVRASPVGATGGGASGHASSTAFAGSWHQLPPSLSPPCSLLASIPHLGTRAQDPSYFHAARVPRRGMNYCFESKDAQERDHPASWMLLARW